MDIDKLAEFDKTSWFFRLNRWGMVSLYEKDHGDRNTLRLRDWVNKKLIINRIGIGGPKSFIIESIIT